MLADGSIVNWSALYARDDLASSAGLAALAYGAFALGMAASRLVGDRLNERFGTASLARAGSGVAALALGGTLLLASPTAMLPGLVLVGAGTANTVPLLFSASLRTAVGAPGRSLATVSTLGYAGQLLGPALVGFLAEATSLRSALATIAVVYGVIAITAGAAFAGDKRTAGRLTARASHR
jgi:MFS family permease